jgi:mannose-1-phosphate guanylyltransferase
MPVNGIPLLYYWIMKLEQLGIEEVVINTHYFAEIVCDYVSSLSNLKIKIILVHEKALLGTAGTIFENYDKFKSSSLLLIHADNWCGDSLDNLYSSHLRDSKLPINMLTFLTKKKSDCGILIINNDSIVTEYHEKPKYYIDSEIANAAIYIINNDVIEFINDKKCYDFSLDVLPFFINKIKAIMTNKLLVDIGDISRLKSIQNKAYYEENNYCDKYEEFKRIKRILNEKSNDIR